MGLCRGPSRARDAFPIHEETTRIREWPPVARSRGKDPTLDYEGNTPMTKEWKETYRVLDEISEHQQSLSGGLMGLLEKEKDSDGSALWIP